MGSFGTVGVEEILRLSSQSTMDKGRPEGRTVSLSQREAINREESSGRGEKPNLQLWF
jgi:hypothetical protein